MVGQAEYVEDNPEYMGEEGNDYPIDNAGQMQPSFGGYGYPQGLQSDKADLLDKIRPDEIVTTIMHRLMGEEKLDGVWIKNPLLKKRALSFRGAWDISNLMLPVSSKNVAISKLNDEDIRKRTLHIAKTAQRMCLKNWREYRIRGTDQLHFVHEIVFSNTFITLKQPENAGIRDLIKGIRHETFVETSQGGEKKGVISGLFRR